MAGEFDLIAKYFRPLAGAEGLELVDDASCVSPPPGMDLIVTKDLLIEKIHFVGDEAPSSIAEKALAVNLSDLAAKGAKPLHYWLGLALPKQAEESWVADFTAGLKRSQDKFGISLAGGDTTASPGPVIVSITAAGVVPKGRMIKRAGARAGDLVFVSGTLGDASLGLKSVVGELPVSEDLVQRYLRPEPQMALGQALLGLATACADVSDGLLADLGHICEASDVGAEVRQGDLPLSAAAQEVLRANPGEWPCVFAGGDDYELVFTVRAEDLSKVSLVSNRLGVRLSCIGRIKGTPGCHLVDKEGLLVQTSRTGYQHF
ncbi:MAG: thiamine-phosphate kinase [Alphaproteobacteria bacterium]|nr:thiamine-phosphate kinase [Alphaproteobacteria bacterium]